MAVPLNAPNTAAKLAQQKLQDQGGSPAAKQGQSKFDETMSLKANSVQATQNVQAPTGVQRAEAVNKVEQIDKTQKAQLNKVGLNSGSQNLSAQGVDPIRANAAPGEYYPTSTYSQYPLNVVGGENVPITTLGITFQNLHFNIPQAISVFGQLLAKLTEALVPLGMIYILTRKSVIKNIDPELYLIACFCLAFIFLNIVLPVLSTEYGIFRALQQSMFIIAPIIVAGAMAIGTAFKKWFRVEVFASMLTAIFFLYSTHFLPYLFGNTPAVLHLSNRGTYYDDYYIQSDEIYGVDWLTSTGGTSQSVNGVRLDVQTSRYNKFASLTPITPYADIIPAVIRRGAFVFLAPVTVLNDRATVIYNADQVNYAYPTQFLQTNKDLIYNNGGSQVYR